MPPIRPLIPPLVSQPEALHSLSRSQPTKMKLVSQRISRGPRTSKVPLKSPRDIKAATLLPWISKKSATKESVYTTFMHSNLDIRIQKSMEKPHNLSEYNRKGDPYKHTQLVNDWMNYYSIDEASKCKLFALTLVGSTRQCLSGLRDRGIESWMDFYERLIANFVG